MPSHLARAECFIKDDRRAIPPWFWTSIQVLRNVIIVENTIALAFSGGQ